MTPSIENRLYIRELIQTFARIDECFDDPAYLMDDQGMKSVLQSLDNRLDTLISFPIKDNHEAVHMRGKLLDPAELHRICILIPDGSHRETHRSIRRALRDNLHELLVMMDDYNDEDFLNRRIIISPQAELSLTQLQQLVVYMIEDTLTRMGARSAHSAEKAMEEPG